ncbi:CRISPR-associated protein Cmr4 [Thermosyntropha lipolytica DSM 11003]|uniref:CRISPR-associated protein Cmr4 n=1 Tax=Thermosyntropha lipolytica DSM 11003 TaxID=1123382 RepID=A0A1M5R767_9FIRM|nr:RAMP superfamily CRISPR-associated protein [Thermosyntropha lipolytica]SHH22162.1 CRISPR-associated protein Cmr4 [Thermosyntropha lipolytica DSM 11003]
MMKSNLVHELSLYGMASDPIYVGTGGYTIGRVDNTIVRDPITKTPKIPGSTLAGVWRYYTVLKILAEIKKEQPTIEDLKKLEGKTLSEKIAKFAEEKECFRTSGENCRENSWKYFVGNILTSVNCAGQDEAPYMNTDEILVDGKNEGGSKRGHCGHCIVCKGFGFSKKDLSWQGMIFFSDLTILFFPVFTRWGTRWITTGEILQDAGFLASKNSPPATSCFVLGKWENQSKSGAINLGWLYLPFTCKEEIEEELNQNLKKVSGLPFTAEEIVIVPEGLFSQIVNSNLEVRTSVSINPITGAAKEGALFTSEAVPRGTVFRGNIRIFDKQCFAGLQEKIAPLPSYGDLEKALKEAGEFFNILGIGGMTTRGFGRLKIAFG